MFYFAPADYMMVVIFIIIIIILYFRYEVTQRFVRVLKIFIILHKITTHIIVFENN